MFSRLAYKYAAAPFKQLYCPPQTAHPHSQPHSVLSIYTFIQKETLSMKFQLDSCDDADMARAFKLLSISFSHEHP